MEIVKKIAATLLLFTVASFGKAYASTLTLGTNADMPLKGSSLVLSCVFSDQLLSNGIEIRKGDVQITSCTAERYLCKFYRTGYNFTTNQTGVFGNFMNLSREAEGTWICRYTNPGVITVVSNPLNLTVYTIPPGLVFAQEPNMNVDLSVTSAKLDCTTSGCTYPSPLIQWLVQGQTTSSTYEVYQTDTPTGTVDSCVSPEQFYTSTLVLQQNTILKDNSDKTFIFSCRIEYPDPIRSLIAAGAKTIKFAVRVTEAVLQQNNQNITVTLRVTSGLSVTLTCMTGTSRPAATIDWYIESQKKSSGNSLTFIPNNADHDKMIYCQAYNTDPNQPVPSQKPRLFVEVRVTEVVLQQNNQNISGTLNVTAGLSVTLTCMTGISRPAATIDWYIGSQKRGSGTILTFIPSNADHDEMIYCLAYNTEPSQPVTSMKIKLFVKVNVAEVTLVDSMDGIVVLYERFPRSLRCTHSPSRPVPTIKWWLENRELTDNITNLDTMDTNKLYMRTSEINLIVTRESRNQKIFCNGFISGQMTPAASSQLIIDVWYQPNKPEVRLYGTPFPWLENQTGTLQCYSSNYGNPSSSVTWSRGTANLMGHLVLTQLTSSDNSKLVSCQLINNYTIDKNVQIVSEPLTLSVEYFPIVEFNTSSSLIANETQWISVMCTARGNPNPDQPFWRGRSANSILNFDNISRTDTDKYNCEATARSSSHGELRSQRQLEIVVQFAPDVNVTVSGSTQGSMSSTMSCEVKGIPAQYTFHPWKQLWEDVVIRSDLQGTTVSTSPGQNTLKFERLSLQDMGTYFCSVDNMIKGINGVVIQAGSVDLKVTGIPSILKEDDNMFAEKVGQSISISIPFYSYPAIQEFSFQRNGTAVTNTSQISMNLSTVIVDYTIHGKSVKFKAQVARLFIQNLTEHDFDNYTLVLKNSMGTKTFKVQLDASGPPLMINRFYFNRFIENQIELHFDPGFNGGRVQTFVIEYKSTASSDMAWNNSTATDLKETQTHYRLPNGTYFVNVTQLSPGSYEYRMYSWNEIGKSPYSKEVTLFIPEVNKPQAGSIVAAIGGGIGAAVVIIAVIVVVLIFIKRRLYSRNKSGDEKLKRGHQKQERRETGLVDNPVYDASGNLPSTSTGTGAVITEYAVVVKPKHHQKAAKVEDPINICAQVDKKNNKTDKKGASKQKLGKVSKITRGDIYENATLAKRSTSKENVYENSEDVKVNSSCENTYENPGAMAAMDPVVNKDGLLYADLDIGPPTTKAGKPVIHGLDNRTEYAEIAYGKKGKPLPESDEEKESGGAKKNNGTKLNTDE